MTIHTNGDNNRIAGRDYHEHNAGIREDEPEWRPPPYASGLILCPGCRRRHIARNAIACTRCGYPQREIMLEEHRRSLLRLNHEKAKQQLYGCVGMLSGFALGLYHFELLGLSLLGLGLVSGFITYMSGPSIEAWLRDLFEE